MRFLLYFIALIAVRAFDMWTTWRVSPNLDLEINPIVRWLTWRYIIPVNICVCLLAACVAISYPIALAPVIVVSTAAGLWNLRILRLMQE